MTSKHKTQNWWEALALPSISDQTGMGTNWGSNAFRVMALQGGPPAMSFGYEGEPTITYDELRKALEAKGFRLIESNPDLEEPYHCMYVSENAILQVQLGDEEWELYVSTNDEVTQKSLSEFFDKILKDPDPGPPPKGPVYALTKNRHGFDVSYLGENGSELIRDNYSERVIEEYDHVIEDLSSEEPCGRLVIFSGEPGCGKTYLVRSILSDVKNAVFVLVPPHLIQELGGPEMLPCLLSLRRSAGDRSIIFLAEDGDDCLVTRDKADMAAIQAVLNLGDGILGSVLNVRIVVTTNAADFQMEEAALRPGRLCRHVKVGKLSADQAKKVFKRLAPKAKGAKFPKGGMTLAEVYALAHEHKGKGKE